MKKEFRLWQRIATAQMLWTWEIIERLELPATVNQDAGYRFSRVALVRDGEITDAGNGELRDLSSRVDWCYQHICSALGDPLSLEHPEYTADLGETSPGSALAIAGLELVDAVLIGPALRAAELVAADQRLHAAARSRVAWCDGAWGRAMAETLARADSLLAAAAIAGVPHGRL